MYFSEKITATTPEMLGKPLNTGEKVKGRSPLSPPLLPPFSISGPKRGTYGGASGDFFLQLFQCLKAFPTIWGWNGENKCFFFLNSSHRISEKRHEISKKCLKIWKLWDYLQLVVMIAIILLPQRFVLPILWKSKSTRIDSWILFKQLYNVL